METEHRLWVGGYGMIFMLGGLRAEAAQCTGSKPAAVIPDKYSGNSFRRDPRIRGSRFASEQKRKHRNKCSDRADHREQASAAASVVIGVIPAHVVMMMVHGRSVMHSAAHWGSVGMTAKSGSGAAGASVMSAGASKTAVSSRSGHISLLLIDYLSHLVF